MSGDKRTFISYTAFLVSNTIKSYQFQYIVQPIMYEFIEAYRNSDILKESIRKYTSKNPKHDYQTLLDHARGKTLLEPNALPSGVKLIFAYARSIDDKRNVIYYVYNRVLATIDNINKKAKEKGLKHLDSGSLHWDLLIDIEFLLYSCRALLDIFARLTKNILKPIYKHSTLPDSFNDQVKGSTSTYRRIDPPYFDYISGLHWFEKLIEYRDSLSHYTSLRLNILPSKDGNFAIMLYTSKDKLIGWSDLDDIVKGIENFCNFYVQHYQKVLSQTNTSPYPA